MIDNSNIIVADPQPDTQQNTPVVDPILSDETPEQINWKKYREERKVERKQKEESDKKAASSAAEASALKAAMDALLNKPAPQQSNSYNNSYQEEETEDERINKKVEAALKQREQVQDEQRRQREHAEFPQRLASTFSDFQQVCSEENLDYLEYHHPEVAAAFKLAPDGYEKWAAVYKAVKKFIPNTDSAKDQKKAERNFNKPQSISSVGVSPSGDNKPSFMLDDAKKKANYERMQRIIKGQ